MPFPLTCLSTAGRHVSFALAQVPFLKDPNTGVELFESPDILDYLEEVYTV